MKIAENITYKTLQDKVVAVDITTGVYYTMNAVASHIWLLLEKHAEKQELLDALIKDFPDTPPAQIEADLDEQLGYWKDEKMIV
ncbi:MAG: PqqD family protein [Bacteroidaceae bacterium]|nr:PqqD family protein [Bacteroidaceae bacterium]